MDVVVLDENLNLSLWEDYVASHPQGSNYHQVGWKTVIERSFGHQTRYLLALEGGGVVGILPLAILKSRLFGRSVVSLPFLNYGGLLGSHVQAEKALVSAASRLATEERVQYIELRHWDAHGLGLVPKHHKVTMLLPLASGIDAQWKQLNPKVRNQIRKAGKSGLTVQVGGKDLLPTFYAMFARNMRDLGTPVYGRVFFESILEVFPLHTRIFVVKYRETPVAAGLSTIFRETMEVPWAGSLVEYRSMCPNMLLYWEAIQFGIQRRMKTFDFGRSTPGEGTYRFKAQWGAKAYPLVWEYWTKDGGPLPNISPTNAKFSLAIKLWKKLPLAVANLLGPTIVRAIP
jgi:FemAB-related protein (PEP-CTERM system-associated)